MEKTLEKHYISISAEKQKQRRKEMAKTKNVIAPEVEDDNIGTELIVLDDNPLEMAELGNFEDYKNSIKKYVTKCKKIKLTDTNLNEVKKVKSSLVSLRTNAVKIEKSWMERNIKLRKTIAEAAFASVHSLIKDSESAVDAQLDIYYTERKEQLTAVYKGYIADINTTYAFTEAQLEKIEILERYFNLSIKEKEVYNDILSQFETIKREEQEKKDAEEMIHRACKGTTLNPDTFLEKLQFKSAISVVNEIEAEKERLAEIASIQPVTEEKLIIGKPAEELSFGSAKKKPKTKKMKIEITYEDWQGEAILKFFKDNNIKVKEV